MYFFSAQFVNFNDPVGRVIPRDTITGIICLWVHPPFLLCQQWKCRTKRSVDLKMILCDLYENRNAVNVCSGSGGKQRKSVIHFDAVVG